MHDGLTLGGGQHTLVVLCKELKSLLLTLRGQLAEREHFAGALVSASGIVQRTVLEPANKRREV
jgi:hypothetical protein